MLHVGADAVAAGVELRLLFCRERQLDALLDDMSDNGIRIVTATAKEISEVEKEDK